MEAVKMKFHKRDYLYRFLIVFITAFLCFGFHPEADSFKIITKGNQKYLANTVVVKFKNIPAANTDGSVGISKVISSLLKEYDYSSVTSMFPNKINDNGLGLGRIVTIKYNSDSDPYYVSSKLKGSPDIEWAEPKFVYELDYTVNDPDLGSQWNLTKIKAALAWDVTKGDTNVVIGIVDTGVDWDHPDLAANMWRNWDETVDGKDDDGNGYVDDIRGWDFAGLDGESPENDPMEDVPRHGTHVAGIASAVTDNGTGIASIGFKCKLLPVKVSAGGETTVVYGNEGIVYAADNGAKIINCSWGGYGYSILGQEVIDYAISKGALVVAAAGNENSSLTHYPSSYKGVFSVASTNTTDSKSDFSNYGKDVDVSAPGSGIYSTWMDNSYLTISGTSMASPLAAGLAALVLSHFPGYTPMQVGEQVRVNSFNIDNLNTGYENLLGYGRIDAQSTLTNNNSLSVRATDVEFSDEAPGGNGDGIFTGGETITIGINFINYLNPTYNLQITLVNKNDYSTIGNGTFNAGAKSMLEPFDNYSSKFTFTLSPSLPPNINLDFILNFSDNSYSDYQWIGATGNPTYATQSGNDVSLTITSKGVLSFNDFPTNLQGKGFHYLDGPNLLFEGALILATSATQVSDAARGGAQGAGQNTDFTTIQPFVIKVPGSIADQQGSTIFNDDGAGDNKIGITTKLESFSFANAPDNNYIILKFYFTNNTGTSVKDLYAGLYFDWDLIDGSGAGDITTYDNQGNLSYTYNTVGGPDTYVTTALISSNNYSFYAINNDGTDGGFGVNDANGFTDAEKWEALSNGIGKATAGPYDVSHVIGGGPFTIQSGDTIDVGFVIGAGLNLDDLRTIVSNARLKYPTLITGVDDEEKTILRSYNLAQNYPNPFNPSTKIKYSIPATGISAVKFVQLKVYDVLGNEVATLVDEEQLPGDYEVEFNTASGIGDLASGIYFYQLSAGSFVQTKKMIFLK
jgi:serine protease